jgi:pimeloyl-ACP methyl ester carboxylesterase
MFGRPGSSGWALRVGRAALVLVVACLWSCGSDADEGGAPTPTPVATSEAKAAPAVDGLIDVGGHGLYMACAGTGSPTVVYLHGAIEEAEIVPHRNATAIRDELTDEHRVCLYDRRNVGRSDTVDRPQRPADAIEDLDRLLAAADVEPPYVLLGASFGGLLSYLYMSEHPDDVVGMVLLDSPVPDELRLEGLLPADDRYKAFDKKDERDTLERISHYKVFKATSKHIGNEPAIPMTFLASKQEPPEVGIPEYDRRYLSIRADYVGRFSPGRLVEVDAPHFMEPAIPQRIAGELRDVIRAAGG